MCSIAFVVLFISFFFWGKHVEKNKTLIDKHLEHRFIKEYRLIASGNATCLPEQHFLCMLCQVGKHCAVVARCGMA